MEVSLYTAALDPEFTGKFDDKLDENFAKVGSDNILKDAYFDDLKKAFGINGGDEFDEKKVKKYIEEVSRGNPELFVSKNGKVSTPDQIIAGFRGSWDFYRQGTKTLDRAGKLENLDSNNGAKGAYDRGVLPASAASLWRVLPLPRVSVTTASRRRRISSISLPVRS